MARADKLTAANIKLKTLIKTCEQESPEIWQRIFFFINEVTFIKGFKVFREHSEHCPPKAETLIQSVFKRNMIQLRPTFIVPNEL